jgi:hypothetical protein
MAAWPTGVGIAGIFSSTIIGYDRLHMTGQKCFDSLRNPLLLDSVVVVLDKQYNDEGMYSVVDIEVCVPVNSSKQSPISYGSP